MQTYLTISELAKLMDVSIHQIRYFEEKGILNPAYTGDNHYRMYGIEEIYRLSHILLLRELEVPASNIRVALASYAAEDYEALLNRSITHIEADIERLQRLRGFTGELLQRRAAWKHAGNPPDNAIERLEKRILTRWIALPGKETFDARSLLAHKPNRTALFKTDLHLVFEADGEAALYIAAVPGGSADLILEAGDYLVRRAAIAVEDELEREIEHLLGYAAAVGLTHSGTVVAVERSYMSMFDNGKLHYEIQLALSLPGGE
ncbi:MerR family transcriptional regulator [Paenibacillus aurantiacus]|uniref:MerR family transcriptional regulator n=1 Tax=Paenibacillus aurantiacus TaxID=1936118 RepID=A0ABV5KXK7_9BACL